MRWIKLTIVAAWLGAHAFLWTLLPPVPRLRMADDCFYRFMPDGLTFAIATDDRFQLRALADGHMVRDWPRPEGSARGATYLWDGRRVVMKDDVRNAPILFDLESGRRTPLPSFGFSVEPRVFCPACFGSFVHLSADGQTVVQAVRHPDGMYGFAVHETQGADRFVPFGDEPLVTDISRDACKAIVIRAPIHDSNEAPVRVVDLTTGQTSDGRLPTNPKGCICECKCDFSPDMRTVAIAVSNYLGTTMNSSGGGMSTCGYSVAWFDVSTGTRFATREDSLWKGWTANGDCVVSDISNGSHRLRGRSDPEPFCHVFASYDHAPELPVAYGRFVAFGESRNRFADLPDEIYGLLVHRFGLPAWTLAWEVLDLETGRVCRGKCATITIDSVSPDGKMLLTRDFDKTVEYEFWDLPPRKPTGIVLGLMIVEVIVAIAWTNWRRRRARRLRCAAR
jgi:hypothetical protein